MRRKNTYTATVVYRDRATTYVLDADTMQKVLQRLGTVMELEEIESVSVQGSIFNPRDPE